MTTNVLQTARVHWWVPVLLKEEFILLHFPNFILGRGTRKWNGEVANSSRNPRHAILSSSRNLSSETRIAWRANLRRRLPKNFKSNYTLAEVLGVPSPLGCTTSSHMLCDTADRRTWVSRPPAWLLQDLFSQRLVNTHRKQRFCHPALSHEVLSHPDCLVTAE